MKQRLQVALLLAAIATLPGSAFAAALPSGFTGIWYDPATSGQGFTFEVLPDQRLLVLFNGFTEAGERLPLTGDYSHDQGVVFGRSLRVPLYRTRGRGFASFDPTDVVREPWGDAHVTFTDCSHAELSISGSDGSQQLQLVQLSRPIGLACTQ